MASGNYDDASPLEAITIAAEKVIYTAGASLATSLSAGYEVMSKQTEDMVFEVSKQIEDERRAAEEEKKQKEMKAAQEKAEEDYEASMAKKAAMIALRGEERREEEQKRLKALKSTQNLVKAVSFGRSRSSSKRNNQQKTEQIAKSEAPRFRLSLNL